MNSNPGYYKQVADYYDQDASHFETRYQQNPLLQRIRNSFRNEMGEVAGKSILEIGYGPGLDLIFAAETHPEAIVYGIDISQGMFDAALSNIQASGLKNIRHAVGGVEEIKEQFNGQKFDLVFVFFGALNTVDSIDKAAAELFDLMTPGGKAVLTFVNKWYMRGLIVPFIKGKWGIATRRLRKVWGGYSTKHFLPSRCYSIGQIKRSFKQFECIKIRGYSIFYPAWYDAHKYPDPSKLNFLWNLDERIGKGFAKGWGEYSLFVFRKRA